MESIKPDGLSASRGAARLVTHGRINFSKFGSSLEALGLWAVLTALVLRSNWERIVCVWDSDGILGDSACCCFSSSHTMRSNGMRRFVDAKVLFISLRLI